MQNYYLFFDHLQILAYFKPISSKDIYSAVAARSKD